MMTKITQAALAPPPRSELRKMSMKTLMSSQIQMKKQKNQIIEREAHLALLAAGRGDDACTQVRAQTGHAHAENGCHRPSRVHRRQDYTTLVGLRLRLPTAPHAHPHPRGELEMVWGAGG